MRDSMYNILIVDDEKIEREAIRMIVESSTLPFSLVFEASSGREMLELLKAHHVDIVILDINMPGLTGLQALEMMRADGMDTKVIISTAYDEFNYAVKALQSGAVDFLVKPVSDESLIESLKKSIERLSEERERNSALQKELDTAMTGIEEIKAEMERLKKSPQARPAHEEFSGGGSVQKTGNKGLDNLARIMNA